MPEATTVPPVSEPRQRQPITDDDCRALAGAMQNTAVAGNLAAAAKLLGIAYSRAAKITEKDTYLRALQPAVDATKLVPTQAGTITRPPLPPDTLERAREMLKQNKLLVTQDWTALGLSEDHAKSLVSLERFANLPLLHSIKTTHGGMMFSFARLLKLLEKYADELETSRLPTETITIGGEPVPRDQGDVERDWLHAIVAVSAEIRQVNASLQKGNLLLLKAQQIQRELGKGKGVRKPKGPPQYNLVQAQSGSTVHLHSETPPAPPANG